MSFNMGLDEGGKTFEHQPNLPSLPVPDLDQTLDKYLKSVKPFCSEEEFEHTQACVADFRTGVGQKLHQMLVDRADEERNWLEEWWEMFAYMQPRYPSALNINYHGVLPGNYGLRISQAESAAFFSQGVLEFFHKLNDKTLEPETMGGQPLCMNQYTRMFHSCRIPGEFMDEIEVYKPSKHIVVLKNNSIYQFDVLDADGKTLPHAVITEQFQRVVDATTTMFDLEREPAVSVLTSENRTTWYQAREKLIELDAKNEASLEVIEKALFAVNLEEGAPSSLEDVARGSLHGNGRNKWFDKPFNLVIFENGRCGCNGEHAWADAIVIVNLFDWCLRNINDKMKVRFESGDKGYPTLTAAQKDALAKPQKCAFVVDSAITGMIETASSAVSKLIGASDLRLLVMPHYGKKFLKRYKLSSDFFVQMAIQLAWYRLNGSCCATYETGHTRVFYHGRTETVRTCSEDSVAWCETMEDKDKSDGDKWNALKTAISAHYEYIKGAMTGQGVDRHLMGMRIVSEMNGIKPTPSIFTDPAYRTSSSFKLSTSNIGATPMWGGFSPFTEDGVGVCYGIRDDKINFSIVANHNSPTKISATIFKAALEKALIDMQELCLTRNVMYLAKSKL